MGCCRTASHFTALHQLSIWNLIARQNISMPTKGSCLKLITSGPRIRKVKRMTLITPSMDEFLLFLYYTTAGLHQIGSSNFRCACKPPKQYRLFLTCARRLNNGYYILKSKNMRQWFQISSKICNVSLIVLTTSSRSSNRWIKCTLYLLEKVLNHNVWCGRIQRGAASITYGLYIIMSI
jgi:hypothetical protein